MGALHNGICYPDEFGAKLATCTSGDRVWADGATTYSQACTVIGETSYEVCLQTDGAACTTRTIPYPNFVECDFAYTTDLSLAWMAAALLLFSMLFGLKHLYNLFSGRHDE